MATGFCAPATGTSDVLAASATMNPAATPNPRFRTIPSFIIRSLSLQSPVRDLRLLKLDADPASATAKTCLMAAPQVRSLFDASPALDNPALL